MSQKDEGPLRLSLPVITKKFVGVAVYWWSKTDHCQPGDPGTDQCTYRGTSWSPNECIPLSTVLFIAPISFQS